MVRVRTSTGLFINCTEFGSGPPLVLLEGVHSGWVWARTIPALSPRFRMIVVDHRGTGLSDKPPGPYSVPVLARETADVIRSLDLGPVHVMAMSLGGSVAQELALSHPDLVRRMVLIGSTAGGWFQFPFCAYGAWLQTMIPELGPELNLRRTLPVAVSPHWRMAHPTEFEELTRLARVQVTPLYARQALFVAGYAWEGSVGRAAQMRAPILAVNGGLDMVSPVANAFWLATLLPTASVALYPWSGHLVNWEQTEQFNQQASEFLLA